MHRVVLLAALLIAAPLVSVDGPLRLDLDTPIELNSFTYSSRQLYNAGERPVEVIIELVAMTPRWFGGTGSPSKILAHGEKFAFAVASGVDKPGKYQGTLRVRVIEPGADWPPLDGESGRGWSRT